MTRTGKAILGLMAVIFLAVPIVTSCNGHPVGFAGPRELTDNEKKLVTQLGINTAKFPPQVETNVDLTWTVIIWKGSQKKEIRYLPADVTLAEAVKGLTADAVWYPAVIVSTVSGSEWVHVTVDLATRKVIDSYLKPESIVPPPR